MSLENKKNEKQTNKDKDVKKLILQLHAKIDLIKGCVLRLEQELKKK